MAKGISTDQNVATMATCLREEGFEFVFRYYSASAWKRMEVSEAAALTQGGLKLAVVYEDGPIESQAHGYFTAARGVRHAQNAYEFASDIVHQPRGSAIYFAVDYDYVSATDLQGIVDYFTAVRDTILQQSNSGGKLDYEIGVYGSGSVCGLVKENENLAKYSWLAESTGWDGYSNYKDKCDVIQNIAASPVCQLRDYELCTANADFGAFSLTLAHLPIRLLASADKSPDAAAPVFGASTAFLPGGAVSRARLPQLTAQQIAPGRTGLAVPFGASGSVQTNIYSTEFGGGSDYPQESAYGGIVDPDKPQVALPAMLPNLQRRIMVTNIANGRSVSCLLNDLGPWNLHDAYWATGQRPAAEYQMQNGVRAENGSVPTNPAGIDLTPAAMQALGVIGPINTRSALVNWQCA